MVMSVISSIVRISVVSRVAAVPRIIESRVSIIPRVIASGISPIASVPSAVPRAAASPVDVVVEVSHVIIAADIVPRGIVPSVIAVSPRISVIVWRTISVVSHSVAIPVRSASVEVAVRSPSVECLAAVWPVEVIELIESEILERVNVCRRESSGCLSGSH